MYKRKIIFKPIIMNGKILRKFLLLNNLAKNIIVEILSVMDDRQPHSKPNQTELTQYNENHVRHITKAS